MDALIVLTIVLLSVTTNFVQGQSRCTTPSGKDGKCVVVSECPPLYALINKSNRSPQDIDLLRKSHCGYQGTTPKVCCDAGPPPADKCFTADGQVGECVGLYSCPHVMQMLAQQPVPQETLLFVQNSRCTGKESYSVCCLQASATVTAVTPSKECRSIVAPPDPKTECCGRDGLSGNRITGGNVTAIDQYPWLTLIEYQKDNRIKLLCGGVLISGRYVLTAGHCVLGEVLNHGAPKNIRLGEYDTTKDQDCMETEGGGTDCSDDIVIIPIELTIPHPEYLPRSGLRRHDIALIRMERLAPYTDFIRPICLPATDVTVTPPPDFRLFAAGWGAVNETISASSTKLDVDLPYKTLQECQAAYNIPRRSIALWNRQLCAGGEKGKDSCKGDSGGPLMYENGRVFEVIGIVSFGTTPCGLEDVPGVYTKVFEYKSWIKATIKP